MRLPSSLMPMWHTNHNTNTSLNTSTILLHQGQVWRWHGPQPLSQCTHTNTNKQKENDDRNEPACMRATSAEHHCILEQAHLALTNTASTNRLERTNSTSAPNKSKYNPHNQGLRDQRNSQPVLAHSLSNCTNHFQAEQSFNSQRMEAMHPCRATAIPAIL